MRTLGAGRWEEEGKVVISNLTGYEVLESKQHRAARNGCNSSQSQFYAL